MIQLDSNKKHIIIKRDGRKEEFNQEKLFRVINWATENENYTNELLKEIDIKIGDRMFIGDLYDEVIQTAVNKISAIQSQWDNIAKKLYLLKIYKETYNLKRIGSYPHLKTFLERGVKKNIYDKKIIETFSNEEIEELNNFIEPNRDLLFNYKGLRLFFDKYCKNSNGQTRSKKIELPQITYLVAAMHSFYNDDLSLRIKHIKECYYLLSTHKITFSTPRMSFGLSVVPQFASCVLITADDDTISLNETDSNAAIYSKYMGGIAIDFSYIRARGSRIFANNGLSDGPIPFIKRLESTISAFNQSGRRAGSGVVYFPWWHLDVFDLLKLKDAGGGEELRARKLKYAIKINNLFRKRIDSDDYITLFDPKEVEIFNETYGEEFEKNYEQFEKSGIFRTKRVKARDLLYEILKTRTETGNLYLMFMENVNEQNILNRFIGMSNLCCEITVPSRPSKNIKSEWYINSNGNPKILVKKDAGEIGLCNLSSIDSREFFYLNSENKNKLVYNLMRGMDNIFETQLYPAVEGEISNKRNRPIGIGITNFANLIAENKLKFTDKETENFTNIFMDDLYYRIYQQSMVLSIERGPFSTWRETKWKQGLTPPHLSIYLKQHPELWIDKKKWDDLGQEISINGVRFSLHGSIPPSATSGKVTNATEACEPILDLFFLETGTHNLPNIIKCDKKYWTYHERCWDVPNTVINTLAAIRQAYLDQSQSFNHYTKQVDSAIEIWKDIVDAMDKGVKTLYYFKTPKSQVEIECSSCSV